MRVLIAEDDDISAELLQNSLGSFGYECDIARTGREAFSLVQTGKYRLVVSDWEMPEMTGVELCREIRQRHCGGYVYLILLTSRTGTQNIVDGLKAGADDFISKPFQPQELCVRLRAGERILALASRDLTIFSLAKLAESRDPETGAHLERIREYCRVIAEDLMQRNVFGSEIDADFVQMIHLTSPLHDIGKVGIPDHVLLKPGRLSADEFEVMKQHAAIGGQTLDAVARAHPEASFLLMAREIAWTHHERFDGTGYPCKLIGGQIPLSGRIVALADVYDALTTKRVYKPAFSHDKARSIIVEGAGTHFDPNIVEAFCRCEEQFLSVKKAFAGDDEGHDLKAPSSLALFNYAENPLTPLLSAQK